MLGKAFAKYISSSANSPHQLTQNTTGLGAEFPGGLYWSYIYVSILILMLSIIRSFSATWQMFLV